MLTIHTSRSKVLGAGESSSVQILHPSALSLSAPSRFLGLPDQVIFSSILVKPEGSQVQGSCCHHRSAKKQRQGLDYNCCY